MAPAKDDPRERNLIRDEQVARLGSAVFDLAVIGGGINGAALARDAAMRGLTVALVDKGDFAGVTSSRSSKLIHGGFRYLPQGRFGLVRHALRERELLRHLTAPHLVRPIRFLFPLYRGRGFGRFTVATGLALYDFFARTSKAERHRTLNAAEVRVIEPMLSGQGLRGGALYCDAWGDDARLTIENVLDASYHGAVVANHLALERFEKSAGRIVAAGVRDLIGPGDAFELRARVFVNATGPWVDDVRRMDEPNAAAGVRLTKGVHLVIDRALLPVREALVLSDGEERIVFVMPHGRYVLIGTTDTDFDGDPASVAADPADVGYLLGLLHESLPEIRLSAADTAASFAGLRALTLADGRRTPSSVAREEVILKSSSGLLTIAGGKLTTHRQIAAKLCDRVMAELGRRRVACPTLTTPLPGARPLAGDAAGLDDLPQERRELLDARYGTRAAIVARLARERSDLAETLAPGCAAIGAEVIHAIRFEMAHSLSDFMVRRTALVWRSPIEAAVAAPVAARLMAAELGWDRAREAAEVAAFQAACGNIPCRRRDKTTGA